MKAEQPCSFVSITHLNKMVKNRLVNFLSIYFCEVLPYIETIQGFREACAGDISARLAGKNHAA